MNIKEYAMGEILRLERTPIEIDPDKQYSAIGIRSFGRGIINYPPTPGCELSKLRYFKFPPNALAISNIKAWEGAFALTSDAHSDAVASNRFLFYVPRNDEVDIRYLRYYFLSEKGLARISKASPGSADRNRTLGIKSFEKVRVKLPPVEEQRRIAARLDELSTSASRIAQRVASKDQRVINLALTGADQILDQWSSDMIPVGQVCTIVNDLVHPGEDPSPAQEFIGLEHIQPHLGVQIGSRPLGEENGRKFRFAPGDILYGYLRPYLNKVWVADRHGLCSVEQYVLRPNREIPAELIAHALRGQRILDQVITLTNNLQLPRLRSRHLLALEIPYVSKSQHEQALRHTAEFAQRITKLASLKKRQEELALSLHPALLNAAFNGQL